MEYKKKEFATFVDNAPYIRILRRIVVYTYRVKNSGVYLPH